MRQTPNSTKKGETMARYLVRVEVPATWTIEIQAEDEDAANIAARELVGGEAGSPGPAVVDWSEAEWTLDEIEG